MTEKDDLFLFYPTMLMCEFLAGKKHSSLWSLVSTFAFVYVFIACREFTENSAENAHAQ